MGKGKTLFEIVRDRMAATMETKYCNPMGARVGAAVILDDLDHRDFSFHITSIQEYDWKENKFADYNLLARPLGKDDVVRKVRVVPNGKDVKEVYLLQPYGEYEFDQGLMEALEGSKKTGQFEILDNGEVTERYFRNNNSTNSYKTKIHTLADKDGNGKVEEAEVETHSIEYWDFARDVVVEGVKQTEFLFIEMDAKTGYFQFWKGVAISPEAVSVL